MKSSQTDSCFRAGTQTSGRQSASAVAPTGIPNCVHRSKFGVSPVSRCSGRVVVDYPEPRKQFEQQQVPLRVTLSLPRCLQDKATRNGWDGRDCAARPASYVLVHGGSGAVCLCVAGFLVRWNPPGMVRIEGPPSRGLPERLPSRELFLRAVTSKG